MKKQVLILVCFLMVLSGIGIVSAETLTGTLGSAGYNSTLFTIPQTGTQADLITKLITMSMEGTSGTATLTVQQSSVGTVDSGAPAGIAIPFTAHLTDGAGAVLGQGTIGYQRVFNTAGTETPGFMWIYFSSYSPGSNTGQQIVYLNYSHNAFRNYTFSGITDSASALPTGSFAFRHDSGAAKLAEGAYNQLKDISTTADYTVTKPAGIGINGTVTKIVGLSQAFVFSSTGTTITSEAVASENTFNFSVPNDQIIIGIYTSGGVWYNSSTLFSAGTGTPTPTGTPVGPENPIPAGYVRSMVQCVDGQTSGAIHGANIQLKDVENLSWSNVTARFDGTWWIDTLPGHTIDAYGDASGYTSVSRLALPASGSIMYELIMWPSDIPPAPAGKVTLYVEVNDYDTGYTVPGASITVRDSSGATQAQTTGTSGTRMFEVVNNSPCYITVTKYGYITQTRSITTSVSGTDTVRVELMHTLVTTAPTNTIPPGGVTTAVTVNPHDPSVTGNTNAAAQDMMNYLAANGMQLVQLCFLITILGLLGVRLGK
jgi:hypothetical protein